MNRIILAIVFCLCIHVAFAQFSMGINYSNSSILQKNQLWNINLINNSVVAQTVSINMMLYSVEDNELLMSAITNPFVSKPGITQVLLQNAIQPIDYTYYSAKMNNFRNINSFLPIGKYRICFSLSTNAEVIISDKLEYCTDIMSDPLSPPILNLPLDSATVDLNNALFSWLPPVPIFLFNHLMYDFVVTKIYDGQNADIALQENTPIHFQKNIRELSTVYGIMDKKLDTGVYYAWKIMATSNNMYVCQSDARVFKVDDHSAKLKNDVKSIFYLQLKKDHAANNFYTVTEKKIGVSYYSFDQLNKKDIVIKDIKGEVIKVYSMDIKYGDNYFYFNLDNHFKTGNTYFIELQDAQKNIQSVSFKIEF